ncbi:hypothetical protein Bra1253DRAFT_00137 [Bradyrhizobium sp. WSM1253]|nr:hypothetical protein Bra1253DRAFT_00137 [Bradyrhizobium sp. WSM1253]
METRDNYLLRLASVLDDVGADQQVIIRDRYIEYAFGGNDALAFLQRPKSSPALMAAPFITTALSNRACSPGPIPPEAGLKRLGTTTQFDLLL